MEHYAGLCENRKVLVDRLKALTGLGANYTRAPRMAYIVGKFAVERDGSLTVEDGADVAILETLAAEKLIAMHMAETNEHEAERPEAEVNENEEEAHVGTVEPEKGAVHSGPENEPVFIGFPMSGHKPSSLVNLIRMVCAKEQLIDKATGGCFHVDRALAEELKKQTFMSTEAVLAFIDGWEGEPLKGIILSDERVIFTGFPDGDEAHISAFTALAKAMSKTAMTQKRVQVREMDEPNEKFAFRTWMVKLGMEGPSLKQERRILLENLEGHSAFRNPETAERWKERQKAKRGEQEV